MIDVDKLKVGDRLRKTGGTTRLGVGETYKVVRRNGVLFPEGENGKYLRTFNFSFPRNWELIEEAAELPMAPLGVKPRSIHDGERLEDLSAAIIRYYEDDRVIPIEWIAERNELLERGVR